jgi:hypothetical protein
MVERWLIWVEKGVTLSETTIRPIRKVKQQPLDGEGKATKDMDPT